MKAQLVKNAEHSAFAEAKSASVFLLNDYAPYPKLVEQPVAAPKPVFDPLLPTIFHEPWWLDIVTGGDYKTAEVYENGAVVGRLPYFLKKRKGISYSFMPPMTHFLGPAIVEGDGSAPTRFLRRGQITTELLKQLPPASIYQYKCHREVTDTIPFQQAEFYTSVQFTHEIMPAAEDVLWGNMRGQKRKKIRQGGHVLMVTDMNDAMEFLHFYNRNLENRGMENRCEHGMCARMINETLSRKRGRIFAARDKNNALVAAVFCVEDKTSSFYYMSTRRHDAHQGAISLLSWEAMKDASSRGLIFDFDGLSNASGVLFFTEFGGIVSPRYVVTRKTMLGRAALAIRDRNRESRFFY